MKKFFIILSVIIALLVAALVLLPVIYKGKIIEIAKIEINKNLNAEVDFSDDIHLSIFENFPDFSVGFKDLLVVNKEAFAGDTLLSMKEFDATLDIMSVINGDQIQIKTIKLIEPKIMVKVLEDGTANYNISIEDSTAAEEETTTEEETAFKMALQSYEIVDAKIVYNDQSLPMRADVIKLNHSGKGDFTQDLFALNTNTSIDQLSVEYDGVSYLTKVKTVLDAILEMNLNDMKFTFRENKLSLNEFVAAFDGYYAMPEEGMEMDISFEAQESSFRTLLSLIPAVFTEDFADLKSDGTMAFKGRVNGLYTEEKYPAFNVDLQINNGMFQYPDLPTALNDVNLGLTVDNPDGVLDNTVIDLNKLHFQLDEEPFDAKMLVKHPMSDPLVDAMMNGKVNFSRIKDLIPLEEGTDIGGNMETDIKVKGRLSTIEEEKYEEFDASGYFRLASFKYVDPELPNRLDISEAQVAVNPMAFELEKFSMAMGENDLNANGRFENFLAYALMDETLRGEFEITSNYFNLNPFMTSEETSETTEPSGEGDEEDLEAVAIPDNIDFKLTAFFKRLIYDNLDFNNVTGEMLVRESALQLNDVRMGLFEGSLMASGAYDTKDPKNPLADFNMKIAGWDIQKTYSSFVTVQKLAPIAKNTEGLFDAELNLNTRLGNDLMPIWESFFSKGFLDIDKAVVEGTPVLKKIAEKTKRDEFKRLVMTGIRPSFTVENGRVYLNEPVNFATGNTKYEITGSSGIDQSLDYVMEVNMPSGSLKQAAGSAASNIFGKNVDLPVGERVIMDVKIGGTATNPKITPSLAGTEGNLKDQLKDKAEEEFNKRKEEAERKAREELEKRKEQLKEAKKREEERLRKEAERKKREAEEKARKEAEKQKEKAKEKAKEKLKDLF